MCTKNAKELIFQSISPSSFSSKFGAVSGGGGGGGGMDGGGGGGSSGNGGTNPLGLPFVGGPFNPFLSPSRTIDPDSRFRFPICNICFSSQAIIFKKQKPYHTAMKFKHQFSSYYYVNGRNNRTIGLTFLKNSAYQKCAIGTIRLGFQCSRFWLYPGHLGRGAQRR